jgi:hypothetical protein
MVNGLDSRLAMATIGNAKDIADAAESVGQHIAATARKIHAEDSIMAVQSAGNAARDYSQKLMTTGFADDDPDAPAMPDGSKWVPIAQREGAAAKGSMGAYRDLMAGYASSQMEKSSLTGRYADMMRDQLSGVSSSGTSSVAQHEFQQHRVALDQHWENNMVGLSQEAAQLAFLPDEAMAQRIPIMVRQAMAIYQPEIDAGRLDPNGPIYQGKLAQAQRNIWTSVLQQKIEAHPDQAMAIVAQLSEPDPAAQQVGVEGVLEGGNINLADRPHVQNQDGSISTVRTISVGVEGKEVLIPTVSEDGTIMSDEEAIAVYQRTGRHLGVFESPEAATAYAQKLHQQQAERLGADDSGRVWRAENIDPRLLPGLVKEARASYVSDLDYRAGSLTDSGNMKAAVALIRSEGQATGLAGGEIDKLVRAQKDRARAALAEQEMYREIGIRNSMNRVLQATMESGGAVPDTRTLYEQFGIKDLQTMSHITSTLKSVFGDQDKSGSGTALAALYSIVDNHGFVHPDYARPVTGGGDSPARRLEQAQVPTEPFKIKEFDKDPLGAMLRDTTTAGMLAQLKPEQVGQLQAYIQKQDSGGLGGDDLATQYRSMYYETLENVLKLKDKEMVSAKDAWHHEIDRVSRAKHGNLTVEDYSAALGRLTAERVTSAGSMRGYEIMSLGPSAVPPEVASAIASHLKRRGNPNPTPEQVVQVWMYNPDTDWDDFVEEDGRPAAKAY